MRFPVFALTAALALISAMPALAQLRQVACTGLGREPVVCIRTANFAPDTCRAIEVLATHHGLDVGFFARLIWQESRFDPNAISHAGAQGIAQFMPGTAKLRGLRNAFNPAEALDRSAEYLAEMTKTYGNPGLAAIGYNGGEKRAEGLIAGTRGLMRETRDYVRIITGMRAPDWLAPDVKMPDLRLDGDTPFQTACEDMAKTRRLSPAPQSKPARAPWGVQLAFGTTRAKAEAGFRAKTRSCRKLIAGEVPDYVPVKNRVSGRRGFLMARIGRDTRKSAMALCRKLSASGCTCRVYRNEG
ncbi:lytic transglycosylase domain-containing protein [Aliiroseovarius marinus]|uniref:lytic transglycosylase domain-containing protein n=1 Tax=Aliiroseovarius marinus TaxID=2500159 RepID=UPI003D7C80A5